MISYLGVTIDELVQSFEDSCGFSEDRADRVLDLPIEIDESEEDDAELLAADEEDEDFDDEDDDEGDEDSLMISDAGELFAYGETVAFAAEEAADFLTDYIIADDIDHEWLSLENARGALLALRVLLPELDEIPPADCKYSFSIQRDSQTGYPSHIVMKSIDPNVDVIESLTHNTEAYTGVITDSTALAELFETAGIPEDDRELLADVISEGILDLSEQQCGLVIDMKGFAEKLASLAAEHKNSPEEVSVEASH